MGWKDLSGWLKGAVIGGLIGLILGVFGGIVNSVYIIPIIIGLVISGSLFGIILNATLFKSKAYWLKGGIIYMLIFLWFIIIEKILCHNNLCQEGNPHYGMSIALWGLSMIIFLPLMFLDVVRDGLKINNQIVGIITVAFIFIIGALFGWIIEKFLSCTRKIFVHWIDFHGAMAKNST